MAERLLLLPSTEYSKIRLVKIPDDVNENGAFRLTTGVIAAVEESKADCSMEDIEDALEQHGFQLVNFVLGPELG